MKLFPKIQSFRHKNISAFTLVEMMITVAVFLFIFIGTMVAVQIFGLRVYTLGATKLSATAGALKVLDQIRDNIREAKTVDVGNFSPTTFAFALTTTNKNQGNALKICSTTNENSWTVYYLDSTAATNYLKMAATSDNGGSFGTPALLASYITNQIVFDAEDFQGNILTNDANNRIIRMELDFYQWEYPVGYIGSVGVNAYDYYRLTTKITRRQID